MVHLATLLLTVHIHLEDLSITIITEHQEVTAVIRELLRRLTELHPMADRAVTRVMQRLMVVPLATIQPMGTYHLMEKPLRSTITSTMVKAIITRIRMLVEELLPEELLEEELLVEQTN